MKILCSLFIGSVAALLIVSSAMGSGLSSVSPESKREAVWDQDNRCWVVCPGQRKITDYIDAGFAYLLDIPLALLSPITSHFMDGSEPGRPCR
jgi:hypothetical protein